MRYSRSFTGDDRLAGVFEPDTLLPSQFFAAVRRRAASDAEQRLMIAVLEDGVGAFCKTCCATDARTVELHREAEAWILSDERLWLYSFVNICDVLGIDPAYLRRGLLEWRTRARRARRGKRARAAAGKRPGEIRPPRRATAGGG